MTASQPIYEQPVLFVRHWRYRNAELCPTRSNLLCTPFQSALPDQLVHLVGIALGHPTLPSKLIPSSFCASTANSIGSCFSTSRAKPLTISATAASASRPRDMA